MKMEVDIPDAVAQELMERSGAKTLEEAILIAVEDSLNQSSID